jgi:hypothetical protein
MIDLAKMDSDAYNDGVQNFGMASLHRAIQKIYGLDPLETLKEHNVLL